MTDHFFLIIGNVFEAASLKIKIYLFFHKRMRMEEKERGVEVSKDKARDERNKDHKIRDKKEKKFQDRIYI